MYGEVHAVNGPPSTRQPNVMPAAGLIWPGIRPRKPNRTTWSGVCAGGRAVIVVSGVAGPGSGGGGGGGTGGGVTIGAGAPAPIASRVT